ncbi:hypothetical protein CI105_02255 [Candidatus Izimaplasma bacterium ZiA1]|uniref:leucine-rich repeat domain-containing protein n=1 Tax=Candidatus Izimoplasma sp. ZiA1 TaxID=2024899 RepID=UPI000BAA5F58|nr:hypothetical protein CI105_02255 [Candidatus Izimaplasma bacterium ZiA1]
MSYVIRFNRDKRRKDGRGVPFDRTIAPFHEKAIYDKDDIFVDDLRDYELPEVVESVMLSGIKDEGLISLCKVTLKNVKYLELNQCPDIKDLSPLSKLKNVKYIDYYWNRKATTLWDMSNNKELTYLKMTDCNKIVDFSSLRHSNIEELHLYGCNFFGSLSPKLEIQDINEIVDIPNLKKLSLAVKKNSDGKNTLKSLSTLTNLEELWLQDGDFSFEQFAWLKSKLPNTKGIEGVRYYEGKIDYVEKGLVTLKKYSVIGKRKPRSIDITEKERAMKYQEKYDTLVRKYKHIKTPPM